MSGSQSGRPIRIGVIGATPTRGWGTAAHLPALKALEEFEVTAVGTTRLDTARATAQAFGVPLAFADDAELVSSPEVDAVAITVKVPEHDRLIRAALAAGKHVFSEWPLGVDLGQAVELTEPGRPGRPFRPGHQRTATAHRQMRATMYAAPGVGLAAPQVGVPIQLAVLHDGPERWGQLTEGEREARERNELPFTVLINPTLQPVDDGDDVSFYEGCLSVPGLTGVVARHRAVRVPEDAAASLGFTLR
jgi:peptide deformylase